MRVFSAATGGELKRKPMNTVPGGIISLITLALLVGTVLAGRAVAVCFAGITMLLRPHAIGNGQGITPK
jgi:hypothetical protein